MENTFFLNVSVQYSGEHRLPFSTKRKALAALRAVEGKMGRGRYNNDPENNRHKVISGDGETVFVMEHVTAARVIDQAEFQRFVAFEQEQNVAMAAKVNGTLAAAIVEALAAREVRS